MSNQLAVSPAKTLNDFMDKYKGQIALALPKHISADRMIRLAMTSFSQSPTLQKCDMHSIFASVVIAAQLGLEIGVGGQGYLVPYKGKATFVPGWQGLVDLVSRAGRATVWTGAVYQGDQFDWALGDNPFVKHLPEGDADDWTKITHVYAIGRVNGSQYPVIEVWSMSRIIRHLKKFNKVGEKHYAYDNMEMYARKVALLQVLKYMPKSVEVMRAMEVVKAVDSGKNFTFDGEVVVVGDDDDAQQEPQAKPHFAMPQSKSEKAVEQSKVPERTAQPRTDQEPRDASPLSEAQFDYLKMKLETAALSSADIQKQFGIEIGAITNANFNDVLAWLKNPVA